MSKSRNYGQNEQYEATKSILERETAALLAERNQLQQTNPARQPQKPSIQQLYADPAAIAPGSLQPDQSQQKTQEVVSKLQQIIRLCKQEGGLSNEQMREVVKVETQVLNFLQRAPAEAEVQMTRPKSSSPQVRSHISSLQVSPQVVKYKPEVTQPIQEMNQTWGKEPQNRLISREDTLEIIGEIQRKALGEIIHLQQERDSLKREKQVLALELQKLKIEFSRVNLSRISTGQAPKLVTVQSQKVREDIRVYAAQIQRLRQENRLLSSINAQNQRLKQENKAFISNNVQTQQIKQENKTFMGNNAFIEKVSQENKLLREENLQLNTILQANQINMVSQANQTNQASRAYQANIGQTQRFKQENKMLREENQYLNGRLQANQINFANQANQVTQASQAYHENIAQSERSKQENKLLREENQYLNARLQQTLAIASNLPQKFDNRPIQQDYQDNRTRLIQGQYDSQVAVYENQLRRASAIINELRSRLANVPGIQDLHQQGEKIRRQTTELLQLKARGAYNSHDAALIRQLQQRIRELQQALDQQTRGKGVFLQQLKSFKQRFIELQQENRALKKSKVSFDPVPRVPGSTPQRGSSSSSNPAKSIMKKRTSFLGDYQQTLNEMKKVLY